MIAVERLAEVFVEFADTLVDDFDVIEFLEMVSTRTADMSRTASAGLLLVDPHGWRDGGRRRNYLMEACAHFPELSGGPPLSGPGTNLPLLSTQ